MKHADFKDDFEDAWQEAMVEASKLPNAKKRVAALRNFKRVYEELEEFDPGAAQRIILKAAGRAK
jgi:hypothetical protein